MATLSPPRRRRGGPVATRPCSDSGRGEQGRETRQGGLGRRLASWARWAGLACEQGPPGPVREGVLFIFFSLFFFSILFELHINFILVKYDYSP